MSVVTPVVLKPFTTMAGGNLNVSYGEGILVGGAGGNGILALKGGTGYCSFHHLRLGWLCRSERRSNRCYGSECLVHLWCW